MGGTTDVSHYAGEFECEFETQVAGVRLQAPMMSIHTVEAGYGSILEFDGSRASAGKAPEPIQAWQATAAEVRLPWQMPTSCSGRSSRTTFPSSLAQKPTSR